VIELYFGAKIGRLSELCKLFRKNFRKCVFTRLVEVTRWPEAESINSIFYILYFEFGKSGEIGKSMEK
jgi:hypothetical protein